MPSIASQNWRPQGGAYRHAMTRTRPVARARFDAPRDTVAGVTLAILTLFSGDGLAAAVGPSLPLIAALRPAVVMPHGDAAAWPDAAARIRTVHPTARIWFGAGIDALGHDVARGIITEAAVGVELTRRARLARDLGAEVVVWDGEHEWKREHAGRDLSGVATSALAAVAANVPIVQGFTSYGRPGGHTGLPWRAFLGPSSPVRLALWQNYTIYDPPARAGAPALLANTALDDASVRAMIAAGVVRPEFGPGGAGFGRYVLGYRCDPEGTVQIARTAPFTAMWAAPALDQGGRMDAEGFAAFQAMQGPGGVLVGPAASSDGTMLAVAGGAAVGGLTLAALWRWLRG